MILLGRCAGLEVFGLVVGRRLSSRVANGQRRFRIQVNVTAEQAQLLKMRAAVEGVSVSRVVVDSLFKPVESGEIDAAALRESVVLLREYRRKLEGATTNLNQIAKHANTVSQVPANFGDVVRRLEEVTDEVNLGAIIFIAPMCRCVPKVPTPGGPVGPLFGHSQPLCQV